MFRGAGQPVHSVAVTSLRRAQVIFFRRGPVETVGAARHAGSRLFSSVGPRKTTQYERCPFEKLKLMGRLARAANDLGWTAPTRIQKELIPLALRGGNVVASAHTGEGKTGAYVLPVLQRLHYSLNKARKEGVPEKRTRALILAPTRELALQVNTACEQLARHMDQPRVTSLAVIGGVGEATQRKGLLQGPTVVSATPGRLLALLRSGEDMGRLLEHVDMFVVDECDRMLSMGLWPDVKDIYSFLPRPAPNAVKTAKDEDVQAPPTPAGPAQKLQALLISATLIPASYDFVKRLASKHTLVDHNRKMEVSNRVKHISYEVNPRRKMALLLYLLRRRGSLKGQQVLVFVRSQKKAVRTAERLREEGFAAMEIHKGVTQAQRTNALQAFEDGTVQCLVATDVASRGLDIYDLPCVINFDIPTEPQDYVHRVGRAGHQPGADGMALSFVGVQPEMVTIGKRTVEINERHFMTGIFHFISDRIEVRKVPGPWKDVARNDENGDSSEAPYHVDYDSAVGDAKRLAERRLKEHRLSRTDKPERKDNSPSSTKLRDYREGRYEDMIHAFERKRAVRRGVRAQR